MLHMYGCGHHWDRKKFKMKIIKLWYSIANLEDEEQTPISIPIEMDIEVTILKDTDEDELYQDTKTLLVGFDLSKVKDMKNDGRENELERENTGRKLHHRVRKGYEFRGVDLTVSHKLLSDPGKE